MNKKISIIVPCYGTEKYVDRCIDSIINQTYKNLEIILVNDASPFEMDKILKTYSEVDDRIKIITHENNKGLFRARLSGADESTGDYLCFVDSDDYISKDYIRNLVFDIDRTNSDIVLSKTVIKDDEEKIYPLFDFGLDKLEGKQCFEYYMNQKGANYRWHTIWNKLYKKTLWDTARPYYNKISNHLVMTEDFAFSTVLFFFCKKIVFNEYANYYYCSNDFSSTSLKNTNFKKYDKNIKDIVKSFDYVKSFLEEKNVFLNYKTDYYVWFNSYLKVWYDNVINSKINEKQKDIIINYIKEFNVDIENYAYKNQTSFYNAVTKFNNGYEKIVDEIIKSDIVSFDIFDTLILRPFYEPKDLFKFLDNYFKKLCPNINIQFHQIREESEKICRNLVYDKHSYEEITLDEIYDYIGYTYSISSEKIEKLKKYEIELEYKYCYARKSGQNLYNLAHYLGKRIIITSDIYLSRDVITNILKKNGYNDVDKIYLSNEERLSKATGNLYKIVAESEEEKNIIHIGDNYKSDFENARNYNLNSIHLPKAIDAFWPYIYKIYNKNIYGIDASVFLSFSGVRLSIALTANKFFDNPFVSFEQNSQFNCNPALVGYFAVGMHSFSVTKWIFDDLRINDYDSITFMARDGFLIKKEFDKINDFFKSKIQSNYLPISRKALIPFSFSSKNDLINLMNYFAYDRTSPNDIYKIIDSIMARKTNKSNEYFKSSEDFYMFIVNDVIPNVDENKIMANINEIRKYFLTFYKGKCANFDIGYSAKPEKTLTNILNKPIDTYFIHCNNNEGFDYSNHLFKLNTFYDFKPKFTGLLREYILSELSGSCIKYDIDKKVTPVFEKIEINYYEKWIIDLIQNNALKFTDDLIHYFGEFLDELYFPKYYMSVPFECFLHSSDAYDRLLFKGLLFEDSVNNYVDIENIWSDIFVNSFNNAPLTFDSVLQNFYNLQVCNRNKLIKSIYYLFFDRISLKKKIKNTFKKK